jgi:iron complex outermembrane recepter protein
MNSNPKLSYAIAAILSGSGMGAGAASAATATDTSATDSDSIQEITVTAQRRTESVQDVPITIQALTGEQLTQLNVVTFDELIRYTPNVTFSGNGPGQGNIFMRGLSAGDQGNQSSATTGQFPNVAVYLDDQSMQFPDRNNDVYLVDMERVEVLEGPQGTLFGGGAQAGAIRYITNKPKLDVTEGNVNAGYGITAGGDPNSMGNATINIPLVTDTLAMRATIFTDHRGGYIDNVPGTISFVNVPTAAALKAFPVDNGPTQSPTANNAALVGNNTNPVDYTGIRVSALAKFNEDWNLLLQQNYQNMEADGYFAQYPIANDGAHLAPDQITAFTPAYNKDKYESTAWTLNGRIPNLFGSFGDLKTVLRMHRSRCRLLVFPVRQADHLLRTGRLLERQNGQHSPEPRNPPEHQRGQPVPCPGRRLLGGVHHSGSDELQLSVHSSVQPDQSGDFGRRRSGLHVCRGTAPRHVRKRPQPAHEFQHGLRRGRQAWLPPDRVFYLTRL